MGELAIPPEGLLVHVGPATSGTSALRRIVEAAGGRMHSSIVSPGLASPGDARHLAGDLGAERIHVVATAGRLDRLLPVLWQQDVQRREVLTYEEWLSAVLGADADHPARQRFRAANDLAGLHGLWAPIVGERFTVIADDGSGVHPLSRTLEEILDLPAGTLPGGPADPVLSAMDLELVRQVNLVAPQWEEEDYQRLVGRGVVGRLGKIHLPEAPPVPALPAWASTRAGELTEQREAYAREHGLAVVGELAALRLPEAPSDVGETGETTATPQAVPVAYAASAIDGARQQAKARINLAQQEHEERMRALEARYRAEERELEQQLGAR